MVNWPAINEPSGREPSPPPRPDHAREPRGLYHPEALDQLRGPLTPGAHELARRRDLDAKNMTEMAVELRGSATRVRLARHRRRAADPALAVGPLTHQAPPHFTRSTWMIAVTAVARFFALRAGWRSRSPPSHSAAVGR